MKILQETREEKWQFTSYAELQGIKRQVTHPAEVILLLHGLGERGKRIFRKLLPYLPEDALILAPNGPFPIPRNKEGRMDFGHSWYFYDKFEQKYFVTQDLARYWLRDLLKIENPDSLPVTIIGFSQGGYLAPLAGSEIKETKLIIGLACEFRTTLIHTPPPFPLHAVHGEDDEIVTMKSALNEIESLKKIGIGVDFHSVKNAGHEITPAMGKVVATILRSYGK
ncbi:MAG: alpha/beta hydrolase [Bacteriovoracia bacterium]